MMSLERIQADIEICRQLTPEAVDRARQNHFAAQDTVIAAFRCADSAATAQHIGDWADDTIDGGIEGLLYGRWSMVDAYQPAAQTNGAEITKISEVPLIALWGLRKRRVTSSVDFTIFDKVSSPLILSGKQVEAS